MSDVNIVELEQFHCCSCGILFAMPSTLVAQRKVDGEDFHCPNGHSQIFSNSMAKTIENLKSEVESLKKELCKTQNALAHEAELREALEENRPRFSLRRLFPRRHS